MSEQRNGARRRTLFTVAVRDYRDAPKSFTHGIDAQLEQVWAWWCTPELGSRAFESWHAGKVWTRRDVEDAVHDAGLRSLPVDQVAVIYITGHGRAGASGRHYLLMPDIPEARFSYAYPTAEVVHAALDSRAEHVLVMVDSCASGALHAELAVLRKDLAHHRRDLVSLNVFTSADFDELPHVGEFTTLLGRVRDWLSTRAGYTAPWLTVDEFETELVNAAHREPRLLIPRRVWRAGPSTEPSPCIPNPGYQAPDDIVELARRQVADTAAALDYWLDRATGRVSATDPGWYFSGRRDLTTTVAEFLHTGTGLLIVTGAAGTGKSAVIARAVTLSDPAFAADLRYRPALAAAPTDTVPPVGSITVAVLARNKNTDEIAEQLLLGLGRHPATPTGAISRVQHLRSELEAHILSTPDLCTIVVDGLDEARNPILLIFNLVGPLARLTDDRGRRRVRLIVGVRSSTPALSVAGHLDDGGHELLDLIRRVVLTDNRTEIRTDTTTAQTAIIDYVDALLTGPGSPYASDHAARTTMARTIADHVTPSFLNARLAAQRLLASATTRSADDPVLLASLADGTAGLLRSDILDAATAEHPAEVLLALLRAAAFAQGAGIPWAEVWPAVTTALLDEPPADPDATIAYLLASRLSGYLARDIEDGRIVYRPVHELLAQILRTQPHRLTPEHTPSPTFDPSPASTSQESTTELDALNHQRITRRLSRLLPDTVTIAPHPYLRRHVVPHATLGNVLNDAHVPAHFLPWEQSGRLRSSLGVPISDHPDHRILATWASIDPFLGDISPESRRLSLNFALAAQSPPITDHYIDPIGLRTRWAHWTISGNVLALLPTAVIAMAAVSLPDGRVLLATGGSDGSVRLWDPATGSQFGDPLIGHTKEVDKIVAVPLLDGRVLLATSSRDKSVRLWDPLTGRQVGRKPISNEYSVDNAVDAMAAVSLPDGRVLLSLAESEFKRNKHEGGSVRASFGFVRSVSMWDLATGRQVGRKLTDHKYSVNLMAAVSMRDGRVLLATSSDGSVRLWDPATSSPDGGPLTIHNDPVRAMVLSPEGRVLLATSSDGSVRLWDPATITPVSGPFAGDAGRLHEKVAVPLPDGRLLFATHDQNKLVWLWDPATGRRVGAPLTAHDAVNAMVAVSLPDGRVLLATGSSDGSVRLWDPTAAAPIGDSNTAVDAMVAVPLSDGRVLLATRGSDKTAKWWDPATGRQVDDPLTGHIGPVDAVASVPLPDGRLLLATASSDESFGSSVQLWDLATGSRVGHKLTRHAGKVHMMATVPLSNGQLLLATASHDSDGRSSIRVLDPATGKMVGSPLVRQSDSLHAMAAVPLPNERLLLALGVKAAGAAVWLWDPVTGNSIDHPLIRRTGSVKAVAAVPLPDGRTLLATGSTDRTVRFWDPITGDEKSRLVTGAAINALCFVPHGSQPSSGGLLCLAGPAGLAAVDISPATTDAS